MEKSSYGIIFHLLLAMICLVFLVGATPDEELGQIQILSGTGVQIYMDGIFKGISSKDGYLIQKVSPGRHILKFYMQDCISQKTRIEVKAGEVAEYKVQLFLPSHGADKLKERSYLKSKLGGKGKPVMKKDKIDFKNKVAIIKTNFGDMYFFFYTKQAPEHVKNFISLSEKGFYRDVKFHRILPSFVAQAGQPREDWTEEEHTVNLEIDPERIAIHRPGALSAARTSDPNSATSQFFICFTRERTQRLDGAYSVYGQMFRGFDTLDKLNSIEMLPNPYMNGQEISLPSKDVIITDVVIEDANAYEKEINSWKKQNEVI
jgi:cyclophilin family peptidyl-prolyl cis-trans isomerase